MTTGKPHLVFCIRRRVRWLLSAGYRLMYTGRPVLLTSRRAVYKIVLRPTAVGQLAKEVANTRRAMGWEPYSGHVVEQTQLTPFVAVSRFRRAEGSDSDKIEMMVRFILGRLGEAHHAPIVKAHQVLVDQAENLKVRHDLRSELSARFVRVLASGYFDFELPQTVMHGDFVPQNALIHQSRLVLVDWEYASDCGSVLYDVWFFRRSLALQQAHNILPDAHLVQALDELDGAMRNIELSPDQLNAFGNAMHAIMDFSRARTRAESDQVLVRSVSEVERIVSKAKPAAL